MKVGIQGQPGSYTYIAGKKYYGDDVDFISYMTHSATFEGLLQGEVDSIMVAFENSLIGSIHVAYDELHNHRIFINGEQYLAIHHQLLGLPSTNITDIKHLHSQSPAINQCRRYIETHLPNCEIVEEVDTSYSAELVSKLKDPSHGAIASHSASKIHGLEIIASDIEDSQNNYTRFLSLSMVNNVKNGNKATIILTTDHQVGALGKALSIISQHGANLTKIESRPIIDNKWQYNFILDFTYQTNKIDNIIINLTNQNFSVELLGTYHENSSYSEKTIGSPH